MDTLVRKDERRWGWLGRQRIYGARPGFSAPGQYVLSAVPAVARPSGPIFHFDCSAGCPLFTPFVCHGILRQAILDACQLALDAARRLQASPRHPITVRHFRSFFGHDPAQPLPWPGLKDSGIRFAGRFRTIEQALRRAGTLYRCDPCTSPSELPKTAIPDVYAVAIPPNEVRLCPNFWPLPPLLRAGVILHEMFHLRFDPCFAHGATETKRTNAYCYEAFALSFTNQQPEPLTIQKCSATPP
jgi:hypothetical protein